MEPLTMLAIGGGLDLGSRILGGIGAAKSGQAMRRGLNTARGTIESGYNDAMGYQEPILDIGMSGLASAGNLAGQDIPEYQTYGGQLNVEQFLDPSIQYQIGEATKALAGSYLAQGTSKSGAAMKAMSDRAQQIGQQGYQQALQSAFADRNFGAQQHSQLMEARRQARQQRFAELMGIGQMGVGAAGNLSNLQVGKTGQMANIDMAKAGINSQMAGLPYQIGGNILSSMGQQGSQMLGAFSGGMGGGGGAPDPYNLFGKQQVNTNPWGL